MCGGGGELLASSRQRPGMQQCILWCTGHPPPPRISRPHVSVVPRLRKLTQDRRPLRSVTVSDSFSPVSPAAQPDGRHMGDNQCALKGWMRTWKALCPLESQRFGLQDILNGQKEIEMNLNDEQPMGNSGQRNSDQAISLPEQVFRGPNYLKCCSNRCCTLPRQMQDPPLSGQAVRCREHRCSQGTPCQLGPWDLLSWGAAAVSFLFFPFLVE